ncbi:hypothetical protein FNJ87_04845 [Nonlabens mediterrranea]|uniref:Cadherin domain-containing protein n=1 Tax=Nonlabens mediterrranea TaxID=1419947 RepID=A0ABS0A2V2_9FLAO|nr:hypothetical protein [Nonlabens mediterrranea]
MKIRFAILCLFTFAIFSCKDEVKADKDIETNEPKEKVATGAVLKTNQDPYDYCSILETSVQLANTDMETYHIAETGMNDNIGLSAMIYMDVNTKTITQIDFESKNNFKNVETASFEKVDNEYVLKITLYESPQAGDVLTTITAAVLNDVKPNMDFKTVIDINDENLTCGQKKMDLFIPLKKGHSFKRPSISRVN